MMLLEIVIEMNQRDYFGLRLRKMKPKSMEGTIIWIQTGCSQMNLSRIDELSFRAVGKLSRGT